MSRRIQDAKDFGRVAVLMGGRSAEREISLISGQAVLNSLQASGVDAYGIDVNFNVAAELADGQFDRAFNVLHGRGGEDGEIQGLLQAMNVPYTGNGVAASVLSMNKRISKNNWMQQGLSTAKYQAVNAGTNVDVLLTELGLPLFIKPVNEGSSIGMSRVEHADDLMPAINEALKYDQDVIAEQWIDGQEYTVAIVEGVALPAIRLQTPNAFYDYDAKYKANTTEYLCPCGLDEVSESDMKTLALAAFNSLGMEGWGRIDLMQHKDGTFYLLEANSVPGMTDHSLVPMAAKQYGWSFEELVWRILETSVKEVA
jgi:D-alanine-D-alanine ligase